MTKTRSVNNEGQRMDVLIIGAAGGVGRRLAMLLTSRGDAAPGDLIADSVDQLAARMRGQDAVVFSADAHGTGMDQTTQVQAQS
jgi:NAD(P)-dependent dehydrogenase (short-subunit alcohol dehydrogenase family)